MRRLPKREDNDEKQAYYDLLNRWNENGIEGLIYLLILEIAERKFFSTVLLLKFL